MAVNVVVNGTTYTGVRSVNLDVSGGGTAAFVHPEGTLTVTDNGTVDVSEYASASVNVTLPAYTGSYAVTPDASDAVVLATSGKRMTANITVARIPISRTANAAGGVTLTIGG